MLIGSYNHTLDAKGRIFVPARWRDDLGASFVVTKGFDKCLLGMSMERWEAFSQKLAALPLTDRKAQDFVRYISSWAVDCELDKQGRILLSAKLRKFAELEGEATLIGVTSRIEIWSSAHWQAHDERLEEGYGDILARMEELGI